jgi:hypothetical protein
MLAGPEVGLRFVMTSGTAKLTPLLVTPAVFVTVRLPVMAVEGTDVVMLESVQLVMGAAPPLKLIARPLVAPKFEPLIVTDVPAAPEEGEMPVITGDDNTVKAIPLLFALETVTTTFPVVAPEGTVTTMPVELQLATVAVAPLNATVLVP